MSKTLSFLSSMSDCFNYLKRKKARTRWKGAGMLLSYLTGETL